MKLAASCLALLLFVASAATEAASYKVAQTERQVRPQAERHWRGATTQSLSTVVWYPTDPAGTAQPAPIGSPQLMIFQGHPLVRQGAVAAGRHPVIALSHGTGGSAGSLDWIASALAEQGYIVVGVNHPGNTALAPLTREGFQLWWERATDLSDVLDAVLADPQWQDHIDPTRIGAVGFSLGGYTVLELAGARTDRAAFTSFCQSSAADATCHPPEMDLVEGGAAVLTEVSASNKASLARSGDSFRDRRVKAAFVMAPALGMAFERAGLASIGIPVAIIAGEGDRVVPVASNARRFAAEIPQARYTALPGAVGHYAFINECLPGAMEVLAQICQDPPGVDRAAVHRTTVAAALRFFEQTL